jgi:hypothetical protein
MRARLAHIEPSHTNLGLGIRTISQCDCNFEVNPVTYGVLHILLDRVALVFIPPNLLSVGSEKGNSHTLFGRVAFLSPRGHSTTRRDLGHTNSLPSSW